MLVDRSEEQQVNIGEKQQKRRDLRQYQHPISTCQPLDQL
jgi:hypothetical protein